MALLTTADNHFTIDVDLKSLTISRYHGSGQDFQNLLIITVNNKPEFKSTLSSLMDLGLFQAIRFDSVLVFRDAWRLLIAAGFNSLTL